MPGPARPRSRTAWANPTLLAKMPPRSSSVYATPPSRCLLIASRNCSYVSPIARSIRAASVPYHYIAGSAVDPGYRAWLKAALPDVLITELPGSGHFPHLAQPAEVAKALAHFAMPAR